VELLSRTVVRMPGRQHPGVVLQGDTLWTICERLRLVHVKLLEQKVADLPEDLSEALEVLEEALRHYEGVIREQGLSLPY